jgi:hypothetical protein
LFIDFSKVFDLIDHNILSSKLELYNFPPHIAAWSLSFLQNRQQFVKVKDSCSISRTVNAGAPQGTLAGPNDFKLLINDLQFDIDYLKYVDDTTVWSISQNELDISLQLAANNLSDWANTNGMKLNEKKTKELLVTKNLKKKSGSVIPNIILNDQIIERVECFKLLGVILSSDLSWSAHLNYILSKVSKRIYCITLLAKARVQQSDIVQVYISIVRSVLEYACPVWHPGLTKLQCDDIEQIQRRCLKIIYPNLKYHEALKFANLDTLSDRRDAITRKMFQEIKDPSHILHDLLPQRDFTSTLSLRDKYPFHIPICKKTRYGRAFIPFCIAKRF